MIEVDGRKCYLTEAAEHLTNYWVGGGDPLKTICFPLFPQDVSIAPSLRHIRRTDR